MANHIGLPGSLRKYHDAGACIVRHDRDRKAHCHYDENGYDITKSAARRKHYNHDGEAPRGFDPGSISGLEGSRKRRTDASGKVRYRVTTPVQQPADPAARNPKIWDVDGFARPGFPNFRPKARGAHYPYRHQWHHLIPSASLEDGLYHDVHHRKPVLCLVIGGYNLNGKKNVVLLPEEGQVGRIVHWPIHPNNHPRYNDYAETRLGTARDRIAAALTRSNGKVHELDEAKAKAAGRDIDAISKALYDLLEEWGRTSGAGVEINRVHEALARPPPPGSGAGRARFAPR